MKIKLDVDSKFILYDYDAGQPIIIDTIDIDEVCQLGQITCYGTRIWIDWDSTNNIDQVIQETSRVRVCLNFDIWDVIELKKESGDK